MQADAKHKVELELVSQANTLNHLKNMLDSAEGIKSTAEAQSKEKTEQQSEIEAGAEADLYMTEGSKQGLKS